MEGAGDQAPVVAWMEHHQVVLYLGALVAGAVLGLAAPAASSLLEAAVSPVLAALLYTTFLGVPFHRLRAAFADARFMAALVAVNFLVVPAVVLPLSRLVADESGLLAGTLLVLLAPCVDYVMVFTRLAGGAWSRILAASPVLMLLQALVLPLWLALAAGSPGAQGSGTSWRPFAQAFVLMIALPMGLSILTRRAALRVRFANRLASATTAFMVPLMMATLLLVVASQVPHVVSRPDVVARVVPLFVTFALVMPAVGDIAGRMAHQGRQERLALAFSGTTRNSLVVLPLALALPDSMGMAPIVVVTQTLVELVVMAIGVRLLPRFIR
ncbi:arsenic resistance protein [Actinomyces oris]|uniref:Arsenic resistance protein n=1 Tax=Actinomyces oris TaxID=544580 RepID=A0A1Q8X7V3_9ACTO|nr:arsenic resistance protein [Actinomyces oris]OLO76392.1 arsenic resistance protein [Actinomyces oris]